MRLLAWRARMREERLEAERREMLRWLFAVLYSEQARRQRAKRREATA